MALPLRQTRGVTKRSEVTVPTPDGSCQSVLVTRDDAGPWPAVILMMYAGGVRPTTVTMAEHLAGLGQVVLLPEMYYRHGVYEPFERALTEGGVDHTLEIYPALHSFAVPDNPTFDEAAAPRNRQALQQLHGEMLTN